MCDSLKPGDLPLVPGNRTGQMQSIVGLDGIRRSLRFALAAWNDNRVTAVNGGWFLIDDNKPGFW